MKTAKLTLNKSFRRAYGKGKSFVSPLLVCYVIKNRSGVPMIGITSSKKIGCAVKRNRARRVIEAAWREISPLVVNCGIDIVFVARGRTVEAKSTDIALAMKKLLSCAGVIGVAE